MFWVILAISAYFLFAVVSVIDETLLSSRTIKPKLYAFYSGILSTVVLFLLFFDSTIPDLKYFLLALLSGILWLCAIIGLYESLKRYELSRVVSAIGAFLPLFTLGLSFLYTGTLNLSFLKIASFVLLVLGGVLIVFEKNKKITTQSLKLTIFTALLFALSFFTAKIFYLKYSFITGLVWIRVGWIISALFLLFFPDVRRNVFKKKKTERIRFVPWFFAGQATGAAAGILQNLAIYFAPLMYLSFVNALEGIKYVFTLFLVLLLARFIPKISYEKLSRAAVIQKAVAVMFIIIGLILLSL